MSKCRITFGSTGIWAETRHAARSEIVETEGNKQDENEAGEFVVHCCNVAAGEVKTVLCAHGLG